MMKKVVIPVLLLIGVSLVLLWYYYGSPDGSDVVKEKSKIYALAFDRAMEQDIGLNSDIKYICIDTKTFKDFKEEDKKQLFDYIEDKYKVTMLDFSFNELKTEGYIKDGCFQEGIIFGVGKYEAYTPRKVAFECIKWRSTDGANGFRFEAKYQFKKWRLKKCNLIWVS